MLSARTPDGPTNVTIEELEKGTTATHDTFLLKNNTRYRMNCTTGYYWEKVNFNWYINGYVLQDSSAGMRSLEPEKIEEKYRFKSEIGLEINAAQAHHQMKLKCYAKNVHVDAMYTGATAEKTVTLTVASGPSTLTIFDYSSYPSLMDNRKQTLTVRNGYTYLLNCKTDSNYPEANVTWSSSHGLMSTSITVHTLDGNYYRSSKNISFTTKVEDNWAKLRCTAVNKAAEDFNSTTEYTFIVTFGPTTVSVSSVDARWGVLRNNTLFVKSGLTYVLTCETDAVLQTATVVWSHGVIAGTQSNMTSVKEAFGKRFSKNLTFTATEEYHMLQLTCNASNDLDQLVNASTEYCLVLVFGPTAITIVAESILSAIFDHSAEVLSVQEGQTYVLVCRTNMTSPSARVTWSFEGLDGKESVTVNTSSGVGYVYTRNFTFTAKAFHNGRSVICSAFNDMDQSLNITRKYNVYVVFGPTKINITDKSSAPGISSDRGYKIRNHLRYTFNCETDSANPGVTLNWNFSRIVGNQSASRNKTGAYEGRRFNSKFAFIAQPSYNNLKIVCTAVNKIAPERIIAASLNLTVIFGPTNLTIRNVKSKSGDTTAISPFTALESNEYTLICETSETNLAPIITWSSAIGKGKQSAAVTNLGDENRYGMNYTFTADPLLDNTSLTCNATNPDSLKSVEAAVLLDVHYGPRLVRITSGGAEVGTAFTVSDNTTFTLTCIAEDVKPGVRMVWSKGSPSDVRNNGLKYYKDTTLTATPSLNRETVQCSAARIPIDANLWKNTSVSLNVNFGPTAVTIVTENNQSRTSDHSTKVLTVQEGQEYNMRCRTNVTSPSATVTWSYNGLDGQESPTMNSSSSGGFVFTSKFIFTARARHNGLNVTCTAYNNQDNRLYCSQTLELYVIFGPTSINITDESTVPGIASKSGHKIFQGEHYNFSCQTNSVNPGANVSWILSGIEGDQSETTYMTSVHGKRFSKYLGFIAKSSYNNRNIVCVAINKVDSQRTRTATYTLTVIFGPTNLTIRNAVSKADVTTDTRPFTVLEYNEYTLICETSETNLAPNITWTSAVGKGKQSATVTSLGGDHRYGRNYTFTADSSLDNTSLTCIAANVDSFISAKLDIILDVQYGPRLIRIKSGETDVGKAFTISDKETFTLICIAEDVKPGVNITWSKGNTSSVRKENFTYYKQITFKASPSLNLETIECSVIRMPSRGSHWKHVSVLINVNYGPTAVTIDSENHRNKIFNHSTGVLTVHEGQDYVLRCQTSVTSPSATMMWSVNGTVKNVSSTMNRSSSDGYVFIRSLTLTPKGLHNGLYVTCSAYNNGDRRISCLRKYRLYVIFGPTVIAITDQSTVPGILSSSGVKVLNGGTYNFSCETGLVNPVAKLFWTFLGISAKESATRTKAAGHGRRFSKNLEFTAMPSYNNLKILCTAVNELDSKRNVSVAHNLDVIFGPTNLTIRDGKNDKVIYRTLTVTEFMVYTLTCETSGTNPVPNITWTSEVAKGTQSNAVIEMDDGDRYGRNYTFTADSSYDKTHLNCNATNPDSEMSTDVNILLDVHYGPRAIKISTSSGDGVNGELSVFESEVFTLTCSAEDVKPRVNITWSMGTSGSMIKRNLSYKKNTTLTAAPSMNQENMYCYVIRVPFDDTRWRNVSVSLNVSYGPRQLHLYGQSADLLSENVSVVIGEKYTLVCKTDHVWPGGHMRWLEAWGNQTKTTISSQTTKSKNFQRKFMFMPRPELNKQNASCVFRNTGRGNFSAERSVLILVIFGPQRVVITDASTVPGQFDPWSRELTVVDNLSYTMSCATSSVYPSARLWWSLSHVTGRLSTITKVVDGHGFNYTQLLTFKVQPSYNDEHVVCKAQNDASEMFNRSESFTLSVLFGPTSLSVTDVSREKGTRGGHMFTVIDTWKYTLQCKTDAVRTSANVTWISILPGGRSPLSIETVSNGAHRYARNITFTATPVYDGVLLSCNASNSRAPFSVDDYYFLDVYYGPYVLNITTVSGANIGQVFSADEGKPLDLRCSSGDVKPGVNMTWSHGSSGRIVKKSLSYRFDTQINVTPLLNQQEVSCTAIRVPVRGSSIIKVSVTIHVNFGPKNLKVVELGENRDFVYFSEGRLVVIESFIYKLQCITDSVNPSASVRWVSPMGGHQSTQVKYPSAHGGDDYERNFTFNASRKWDNSNLTCNAVNSITLVTMTKGYTIRVYYGPNTVELKTSTGQDIGSSYSNKENVAVTLNCLTDDVAPYVNITWTHGEMGEVRAIGSAFQRNTSITVTSTLNQNEITCRAKRYPVKGARGIARSMILTVYYGPKRTTIDLKGNVYRLGNEVALFFGHRYEADCLTDAVWPDAGIEWSIPSEQLDLKILNQTRSERWLVRTLAIAHGQHTTDGDSLICTAENAKHPEFNARSLLLVRTIAGPTKVTISSRTLHQGMLGVMDREEVTITCKTDAVYRQAIVTWFTAIRNQTEGRVSQEIRGNPPKTYYTKSLVIFPALDENKAHITCFSSNKYSSNMNASETIVVIVSPRVQLQDDSAILGSTYRTRLARTYVIHCQWLRAATTKELNQKLTNARNSGQGERRTVTFTPSAEDHNKVIQCYSCCPIYAVNTSLEVIHGPTKVSISGAVLSAGKIELPINVPLTITCTTDAVFPTTTVEWVTPIGGRRLSAKSHEIRKKVFIVSRQFTFTPRKSHQGKSIQCKAVDDRGVTKAATKVTAKLTTAFGPTDVTLVNTMTKVELRRPYAVIEHQEVSITCKTSKVNPKANVTWMVTSSTNFSSAYNIEDTVCTTSREFPVCSRDIAFTGHRRLLKNQLTCFAKNVDASQINANDKIVINVWFGPDKVSLVADNNNPLEGEIVTLTCSTDIVYPNATISWSHSLKEVNEVAQEKHKFVSDQGLQAFASNSALVFKADRTDDGKSVVCKGQNEILGDVQNAARTGIRVAYGPYSLRYRYTGIYKCFQLTCVVPNGTLFTLQCLTDEASPAVRMKYTIRAPQTVWTVEPRVKPYSDYKYEASFEFSIAPKYDEAVIECTAQNGRRPDHRRQIYVTLNIPVGPSQVSIKQSGGRWSEGNAIVLKGDTFVVLSCQTDYVKDGVIMKMHMFRKGSSQKYPLPRASVQEIGDTKTFKTEISMFIATEDHGIKIFCTATNLKTDYLSASAWVIVDVTVGPEKITFLQCVGGRRRRVRECLTTVAARIVLMCVTDKAFQAVNFEFTLQLKSGQVITLPKQVDKTAYDSYVGKAVLEMKKDYDLSTIWCRTHNSREATLKASRSLRVHVKPGPPLGPHSVKVHLIGQYTLETGESTVIVTNGTALDVVCTSGIAYVGSNINIRIITRHGVATDLKTRNIRAFKNSSTQATASSIITYRHHGGALECTATNTRAKRLRALKQFLIDVTVGPYNTAIESADATTKVVNGEVIVGNGTLAQIRCVATVNPLALMNFSSNLISSALPIKSKTRDIFTRIAKQLSFTRFMDHEKETFVCSATNTRNPSLVQSVSANLRTVVHGKWAAWLGWGECSKTCGVGIRIQLRTCTNPPPSPQGGMFCIGSNQMFHTCASERRCDYYYKMADYLWKHLVEKGEANFTVMFALTACTTSFVIMYIWYMRNAYLKKTKKLEKEAKQQFRSLVKKLRSRLDENNQNDQFFDDLQMDKETADIGRFFTLCDHMVGKDKQHLRQNAASRTKEAVLLIKHELNRIALFQSHATRDKEAIERALQNYQATAVYHVQTEVLKDKTLVEKSRQLILALTLKSTIEKMEHDEDLDGMERLLSVAETKGFFDLLEEFEMLRDKLTDLKTLAQYKQMLLKMGRKRIAELRAYKDPPIPVHETMIATLLILGFREELTRDWTSCLRICQGKKGLHWNLMNFKVDNLHPSIAARAIEILDIYRLEDLKAVSKTAYHFYVWAHAIACHVLHKTEDVVPAGRAQQRQLLGIEKVPAQVSSCTERKQNNTLSRCGIENQITPSLFFSDKSRSVATVYKASMGDSVSSVLPRAMDL